MLIAQTRSMRSPMRSAPAPTRHRSRARPRAAVLVAALLCLLPLSGCAIGQGLSDGFSGGFRGTTSNPTPLLVTLEVDSDAELASVLVDIDAKRDPERTTEQLVATPFVREYEVDTGVIFPLRGVTAELTAGPEASFVSCRLTIDGDEKANTRAEGPGAVAACEFAFRLGPG